MFTAIHTMLHWIALLPGEPTSSPDGQPVLDALHLGWWALQFTPRVALLENAVVLEVQSSERLFGGAAALRQRITQEAQAHGVVAFAHAASALGAVALARHARHADQGDATEAPCSLAARLNPLPLSVLPGIAVHEPTLARLGCRALADVRALPRAGLSRRFGAGLLQTLDQAYGDRPEAFDWLTLPPVFDARLELPGRVESAPALLFAANRLLQQLCAWLAGRQAGISAFTLRWLHDGHRRDSSATGARTVRLGSPTQDYLRLSRLLAEHLQRTTLCAPVGDISLHADELTALPPSSLPLFQPYREDQLSAHPDGLLTPAAQRAQHDALLTLLERLSVRLGADRVLQARLQADHRLECTQRWLPAEQATFGRKGAPPAAVAVSDMPLPCWVLPTPMPLTLAPQGGQAPIYQGKLTLLAGPHRIEAGWWDAAAGHARVTRDYYLASSAHAGLLWVFKSRQLADDSLRSPWYLHGFFA